MRPSFYAAVTLVVSGLQTSALPTNDRSTIDSDSPGQAELGKLSERALPGGFGCISCIATCLANAGFQGWWYDDLHRLPMNRVTTFSICGLACVDAGTCFPAQGPVWNYQTLQMVENDSEPGQMLLKMAANGGLSA